MDSKIPSLSQAEWPEGDGIFFLRRDGVPSLSSSSPRWWWRRTCVPAFRVAGICFGYAGQEGSGTFEVLRAASLLCLSFVLCGAASVRVCRL